MTTRRTNSGRPRARTAASGIAIRAVAARIGNGMSNGMSTACMARGPSAEVSACRASESVVSTGKKMRAGVHIL